MKTLIAYLSYHLLPVTTAFFVAGIGLVPAFSPHLLLPVSSFLSTLLFILLSITLFGKRRRNVALLLLPLLAITAGYDHGRRAMEVPETGDHIYNIAEETTEVILTGRLREMVSYDGKMSRAVVDTDTIRKKEGQFHTKAHGKVRLSFRGKWPEELLPGDHLVIRATIKHPRSFHTKGAFDYAQFLAQKDIWATGFIQSPLYVKELTTKLTISEQLPYLAERLRSQIGYQLDNSLSQEYSAMFRALLLGDRSRLAPEVLELFKATGTFHILAISGLHVGVIATLIYIFLYWLLSRSEWLLLRANVRKTVAGLTIPLLTSYALLAGMNSPVTRAVVMSTIVILALCTDRVKSPAPLVAAAALIILLFDPLQLFTVSFQLSFVATISILFLFPHLLHLFQMQSGAQESTHLEKFLRYTLSAVLVSVVATLGTAPLVISAFSRISTIGPIANLILEPLICLWCLPFGLLSLPFMYVYPPVADLLLQLGSYGAVVALKSAEFLSNIPHSSIYLPRPPVALVVIYFVLFFVLLNGSLLRTRKTALFLTLILGITISIAVLGCPWAKDSSTRIVFLDVGQGSATVLTNGEQTVLIDGGGSSFAPRSVGETVIAPYLWNQGIRRIDSIIVTHPDADHYNGLHFIIEKFPPKLLWIRDLQEDDEAYKGLLNQAKAKGVEIKVPEIGETLSVGDVTIQCVANLMDHPFSENKQANSTNRGLILKSCIFDNYVLFPGDIDSSMEEELMEQRLNLSSNLLLAAHHGSATSNSLEFLKYVEPEYSVISAGASSRGYFPSAKFLETCESLNIHKLNTAVNGTIEATFTHGEIQLFITDKFQDNPLYPFRKSGLTSSTETKKPE